ncbi:hypothetical protein ACIOUE_38575 [Streptomyces xanthochromogenes]|uniref:hypothetical protein n=1 Tax=Streptomyces xanthochromogenes TaxID=67384 RepID=UPI0037F78B6C
MSTQALRLGHPRQSLELADAAVSTVRGHGDDATLAFLLSQRAHSYAAHSQPRAALTDLAAAESHHDRATGPAGPFTAYPRAGLDYQAAMTLTALKDLRGARTALENSLQLRGPAQRRPLALTQARLAETCLALGELEAACVHGHLFLDHYPALKSAQASEALARLLQHIARYPRQPHAQVLHERARGLWRPRRRLPP